MDSSTTTTNDKPKSQMSRRTMAFRPQNSASVSSVAAAVKRTPTTSIVAAKASTQQNNYAVTRRNTKKLEEGNKTSTTTVAKQHAFIAEPFQPLKPSHQSSLSSSKSSSYSTSATAPFATSASAGNSDRQMAAPAISGMKNPVLVAKRFKPRQNSMDALIAASSSVLLPSQPPAALMRTAVSSMSRVASTTRALFSEPVPSSSTISGETGDHRSSSPLFIDERKPPAIDRIDVTSMDDGVTAEDVTFIVDTSQQSGASGQPPEKKPKIRPWTYDESMVYYECLKIHGKETEALQKALEKKSFMVDKTKLKNYYFNTVKLIKQSLQLDEKSMEPLSRDARELFTMINHLEWKKRTNNMKMIPERMKELIFTGSTTVKINKKSVVLKTPSCPCLMKLFQGVRSYDKIPPAITVTLRPLRYGDAAYVRSARQNPLLKLKLGTNERVDRIFKLLELKWTQQGNNGNSASNHHRAPFIRLFAARQTEIGKLVPVEGDYSPAVAMSLNKLKRDLSERESWRQAAETNMTPIALKPAYTTLYAHPFVLTEKIFEEGLCRSNVEGAIGAELYCACGLSENIELCYSVRSAAEQSEALGILLSLLKRDYGDVLSKSDVLTNDSIFGAPNAPTGSVTKKRGTTDGEAERCQTPAAVLKPTSRTTSDSISKTGNEEVASNLGGGSSLQLAKTHSTMGATKQEARRQVVVESAIVSNEVDAFLKQAQGLLGSGERKRKNPAPQKHTPPTAKLIRQTPKVSNSALSSGKKSAKSAPLQNATIAATPPSHENLFRLEPEKKSNPYQVAQRGIQYQAEKPTNSPKLVTDFSQLSRDTASSSGSQLPVLENATSQKLQRTPDKAAELGQSTGRLTRSMNKKANEEKERAELMERLFGDVSLSPSRASRGGGGQSTSNFDAHHSLSIGGKYEGTKSRDMLEKIMLECSITPSKAGASQCANSASGLPDDVRRSMYDMMNTDSQEFVQNFAQLVDNLQHTPKKRKRKSGN